MEDLKEFINELKYNQNVNFINNYENRVDIDYVIERLEDIIKKKVLKNGKLYRNTKKCK